jgi:hypothetical protein
MSTVKGDGWAFAVIDYGFEADLIWVVALDASREIWCVPNREVRMQKNWTAGRRDEPLNTVSSTTLNPKGKT